MSCGQTHSQARELIAQGQEAKLLAETLSISRSSLYYRKRAQPSRAHRGDDERIVAACGEKPAYGYRRVAWWLQRKRGMEVNGNAAHVLRETAEVYKVDVAAITTKVKQEFAAKEKAKTEKKASPKKPTKAAGKAVRKVAA